VTVVFLHAHPDDEAIFTGGTIARLVAGGHRTVVVVATHDEAHARAHETRGAADVLGVARVEFLGYDDSGMLGDERNDAPGSLWSADPEDAARRLAAILDEEQAAALVTYDRRGIYGHPDHVMVHRIGSAAAAHVATVYEATVDREYLHFVETHLVVDAADPPTNLGLAATDLGSSTIEIDVTVDVHDVLDVKREAMAAHASQIPETASAMRLPAHDFAAVYGFEWYLRRGQPGPLDALAT
jgi:LmbE family N-acetylglucosaminyl deacetylase